MSETALRPKRIPALLALLFAFFLALPAAAIPADVPPGASTLLANSVTGLEVETEAEVPAQPGDADPWDSGDAALASASQFSTAAPLGQASVHTASACHSPRFLSYRARAPPSL